MAALGRLFFGVALVLVGLSTVHSAPVERGTVTVEQGSGKVVTIKSPALSQRPPGAGRLVPLQRVSAQRNQIGDSDHPFIVQPVNDVASLHLPTDGITRPSDLERILFARQAGRSPSAIPVRRRIPGDAGFIVQ